MKKVLSLLCLASLMNCFVPSFGATRVPAGTTIPIENYVKTQNNKPNFQLNNHFESDFYFDLQWNFNHFGNSNWCIEKL